MLRELSLKAKARRRSIAPSDAQPDAQSPTPTGRATGTTTLRALRAATSPGGLGGGLGGLAALRPPSKTPPRRRRPPPPDTKPEAKPLTRTPSAKPNEHVALRDGPPPRAPGLAGPLFSAAELLAWRPAGALARCVSRVALPAASVARYERESGGGVGVKRIQPPRLLLCHDFARGYPEWEAAADGVTGEKCPPDFGMWRFNHWAYVDVFVYFSHYRVSPPPKGYIQAAHRHGALALGTFIFENEDGLEDLKAILASFRTRAKAANQLATIAKFFGFDGWLVNVEVALTSPQAAGDLAAFVADLTRATRKLVGPASEVVWYDAITRTGELKWQNELSQENEPFFKAAGAMFTNYHWDRSAPVRSAVKAGPRRTDIFTGIDVYGRGTYGGGGLHTHLALRPIKQSGTSAAIFAPAWTVDRCPPNATNADELEERFWTGPRGKFGRESVATYFKERPVITEMPFVTNFDPGWGPHTVKNGLVVDERRYFNLSRQDVQPSFLRTVVASGDTTSASLAMSSEVALQGSTSVRFQYGFSRTPMLSGTYSMLRLFVANLPLMPAHPRSRPGTGAGRPESQISNSVRVGYDYYIDKKQPESADTFGLVLLLNTPSTALVLVGRNSKWACEAGSRRSSGGRFSSGFGSTVIPTNEPVPDEHGDRTENTGKVHHSSSRLQILGKYVSYDVVTPSKTSVIEGPAVSASGKWFTRVFDLPRSLVVGQRVTEVLVLVGDPPTAQHSVAPSPFMTPSGSRPLSRFGSRFGSRNCSRDSSQQGSQKGSLRPSRSQSRQASRPGSRQNSPPRASDLLKSISDLGDGSRRLGRMASDHLRGDGLDRDGVEKRVARSHVDLFDGNDYLGRNPFERSEPNLAEKRRAIRGNGEGSYANAFAVGGSVDFSEMEERPGAASTADLSANTSRALSRLSSRFGTPSGSKPVSRIFSRLASRQGSSANSLAVSRVGSRTTSRVGSRVGSRLMSPKLLSPTRTPRASGTGALPLLADSILGPGLRSGASTPRSSTAAPLRDLKSALMHAAGSMAGESASGSEHNSGRAVNTVYLGSLRFETYEMTNNHESGRRGSAGMDNDFFDIGAPTHNARAAVARSSSQVEMGRQQSLKSLQSLPNFRSGTRLSGTNLD